MQRKVEKPSCCFCAQHKTSKIGSGAKPKKSYYILEAMQFVVPYIKALGVPSGNLPNPPEQKESFEQSKEIDFKNSELEPQPSSPFQPPLTPTLSSPSTPNQSEPSPSCVSNKKRGLKNEAVKKAFLEYFQTKKKKPEQRTLRSMLTRIQKQNL